MLVTLAGLPARAFTFNDRSGSNFDGSPKFVDPDEQVQNFGRADATRNGRAFSLAWRGPISPATGPIP